MFHPHPRRIAGALLLAALLLAPTGFLFAQEEEMSDEEFMAQFDWKHGPTTGALGRIAAIDVPAGYVFADEGTSQELMMAFGNLVTDTEKGLVAPEGLARGVLGEWFIVFEFDDMGYVEDEDDDLDPDELLESLQEGNRAANEMKERQGLPTLTIRGWKIPPRYDPETNNLEWATDIVDNEGDSLVNHNIRILGRRGVMKATVVCDPTNLDAALAETKSLLRGYRYVEGERYSEYTSGDKVWKYGLGGLVAGGGLAVAAKSGLLKHLWKIILVVVAAVGGLFKKIFGRSKKPAYSRRVRRDNFQDGEPPVE